MILWESRACGRRSYWRTGAVCSRGGLEILLGHRVVKLVPDDIIVARSIFLVKFHDVHHGLRVLFLLFLRDATLLEHPLPVFR